MQFGEDKVDKITISSGGDSAEVTMKNSQTKKDVNIPNIEAFMEKVNEDLATRNFSVERKSESILITILSIISPFGFVILFFALWFLFMNNARCTETKQ